MHYCPRCGSETYGGTDHLCEELVFPHEAFRQRVKHNIREEREKAEKEREDKHAT